MRVHVFRRAEATGRIGFHLVRPSRDTTGVSCFSVSSMKRNIISLIDHISKYALIA